VRGPTARILVCQCVQEVSTFNPVPSTAADFDIRTRDAFLDAQRDRETEVAGALDVLEATPGVEVSGSRRRADDPRLEPPERIP
jgi:hypothetical protein